jgi:hypothetical protein
VILTVTPNWRRRRTDSQTMPMRSIDSNATAKLSKIEIGSINKQYCKPNTGNALNQASNSQFEKVSQGEAVSSS